MKITAGRSDRFVPETHTPLWISARKLEALLKTAPTPLFVYDEKSLVRAVQALFAAFSWEPGFLPRFPVRMDPDPPVLRILQSFEENDGFFHDGQNVRIAGMVEEIRRKTTRNGSMMAYVTLEDDTAAMELLTFSNVLERSGSLLTENAAVVAEGRISVRDEKAPQLVVNRFDPLESFTKQAPPPMAAAPRPAAQEQAVLQASRLYLRLPSEQSPLFGKVRATLNMFPGNVAAVLYFADTGVRRGTQCGLRGDMLQELRALLGEDSVVLK